jgi:hypothetical protein
VCSGDKASMVNSSMSTTIANATIYVKASNAFLSSQISSVITNPLISIIVICWKCVCELFEWRIYFNE